MVNIPSISECEDLLEQYKVPPNIREHSRQVARLAKFLAEKLKERGIDVNIGLVESAGLLHDILKVKDIQNLDNFDEEHKEFYKALKKCFKGTHEDIASKLLFKRYPELASVIKKHRFEAIVSDRDMPLSWEEKLVTYADKRVKHSEIVTLKDRFEDGRRRYGEKPGGDIEKIEKLYFELEVEIFSFIEIKPEEIMNYM